MLRITLLFSVSILAVLTALTTVSHAATVVTDFSNFSESGNLLSDPQHTRDQSFTPDGANVTIADEGGQNVGQEVFLSDEFPTLVAGDRVSVDWDGTGSFSGSSGFGLAICSIENPTTREDLFIWMWDPDKEGGPQLENVNFDGAGSSGNQTVLYTIDPETLFIDRTATGWSFGSITGGTETVHFADISAVGGKTITADGSAVGLWSDMRPPKNAPRTLSNLTIIPVPEPSTFALLGMGVIGMLLLVRRRTR